MRRRWLVLRTSHGEILVQLSHNNWHKKREGISAKTHYSLLQVNVGMPALHDLPAPGGWLVGTTDYGEGLSAIAYDLG